MADENGLQRISREYRRLLSEITPKLSSSGRRGNLDGNSFNNNDFHVFPLKPVMSKRGGESAKVRLVEGRRKYGNANCLFNRDHDHGIPIPRYPLLRSNDGALGLQIQLNDDSSRCGIGFRCSMAGADLRMFFCACFTSLLKIAGLLMARTFCSQIWPYFQALSLCTICIDTRKFPLVPMVKKNCLAPLQGLVAPVLGLTIARPFVRWGFPDTYRTGRFWRRLLPIYFGYMRTKYKVRGKSPGEVQKLWAARHEWGGDKVHRLVVDLSGFYVKSAQILATKADFVPEPWTRRLSTMLDNTPPRPFREVEKGIQEQLGRCPRRASLPVDARGFVPLDSVFLVVEETCIAAASIAQVHGAELKDGKRVVIKVQHLGMEIVMDSDLRNIVWVAKFLEGQLPFDLGPVVREIQKTIPLEFNFNREVVFMETIKANLENGGFQRIVCPEPVKDLCSARMLVMERLNGIPLTRVLHPEASADLKTRIPEVVNIIEYLVLAYGQMFLQDGVFHADPHAGNLLLLEDGRLGLVDFGQCKVLANDLRKKLAKMTLALGNNDDEEIATALLGLGMLFEDADGGEVKASTLAVMARVMFDTCYMHEATVSPMADESLLKQTPLISFNQALWLVVRTIVILRGLCYGLNMDLSSCTLWRPFALKVLADEDSNLEDYQVQALFATKLFDSAPVR